MNRPSSLYEFNTINAAIELEGCSELIPIINSIMPDWKLHEWRGANASTPIISIKKTPAGYIRQSNWIEKARVFSNPVATVCDLIVDLVHAYIAQRPHLICLHSAAIAFNDRLVLFPSPYRAGKSTLATQLASLGGRVYSDDVLPIDKTTGNALALGIQPRLRRPLPDNCKPPFKEFVATRSGAKSDHERYIKLTENEQARLGEYQPISGIVVLQREQRVTPEIKVANKGDMLRDIILRNFVRDGAALEILDLLHRIVDNNDCYILHYSTLEEASTLLLETFGAVQTFEQRMRLSA